MAAILISEFMFGAHDLVVRLAGSGTVNGATIGETQRSSGSLYQHGLTVAEAEFVAAGWARWQHDRRSWQHASNGKSPSPDRKARDSIGIELDDGWGDPQTWPRRGDGTFRLADFPGGIELLAYVRVDGSLP